MTGCSKQSMEPRRKSGLLRRFAPRNDGGWSGANRLDIVAVGIDQERRVIGRAVIGARAWSNPSQCRASRSWKILRIPREAWRNLKGDAPAARWNVRTKFDRSPKPTS